MPDEQLLNLAGDTENSPEWIEPNYDNKFLDETDEWSIIVEKSSEPITVPIINSPTNDTIKINCASTDIPSEKDKICAVALIDSTNLSGNSNNCICDRQGSIELTFTDKSVHTVLTKPSTISFSERGLALNYSTAAFALLSYADDGNINLRPYYNTAYLYSDGLW